MKFWKVTINQVEDDQPLDTYHGVARNALQAIELAKGQACSDRVAAFKQVAESLSMSDEEVVAETQLDLYASEVLLVGDVEFGI